MQWRKVEPVHAVNALLLTGDDASASMKLELSEKPAFLRGLPTAHGDGWAAVFAGSLPQEREAMVPRIKDARPLYEAESGWFLPVGCEFAVPDDLKTELLERLARQTGFRPPVIIVPRFDAQDTISSTLDAYPVRLERRAIAK